MKKCLFLSFMAFLSLSCLLSCSNDEVYSEIESSSLDLSAESSLNTKALPEVGVVYYAPASAVKIGGVQQGFTAGSSILFPVNFDLSHYYACTLYEMTARVAVPNDDYTVKVYDYLTSSNPFEPCVKGLSRGTTQTRVPLVPYVEVTQEGREFVFKSYEYELLLDMVSGKEMNNYLVGGNSWIFAGIPAKFAFEYVRK